MRNQTKFNTCPDLIMVDLDNTLYSYTTAHGAAMNEVASIVSDRISLSPTEFDSLYSQARMAIKERIDGTASSHSRLLYFQHMLESIGLGNQVLLMMELENAYWRTFLVNSRLYDGVLPLLETARLASIPLCIVTDLCAQIQFKKLAYLGIENYFDFVVTSEESGSDKPKANSFKLAFEKHGRHVDTAWMIGDNVDADAYGAKLAVGAITLIRSSDTTKREFENPHVDFQFSDFNAARILLEQLVDSAARSK